MDAGAGLARVKPRCLDRAKEKGATRGGPSEAPHSSSRGLRCYELPGMAADGAVGARPDPG